MRQLGSVKSVPRLVSSQQISGRDDGREAGRSDSSRGYGSRHPHQPLRKVQLRIAEGRGPQEQVVGREARRRNVFGRFQVRKTSLNEIRSARTSLNQIRSARTCLNENNQKQLKRL